ncbi:putative acetyltransferase [Enterococcus sp. PF1-24]|uniref:GNAT family N-acetyltransferase n=1 Tax=unclassified Enterococcus TaxID=2608891 RepID=UPI0024744132|nr:MULTISPECIES: N-acetyltransferase [unclassified Enterococcus]MDH6364812.1 putative acetyltransferase [Enterococcus sp. PFB1-1]MDH6401964.1 putative acetyltransferase [Enterococcus sp. PF1-24]
MESLTIRNEVAADYFAVEEMTREAFWNVFQQGSDEHYLAHVLRESPDFVPELTFVAEIAGKIVGSIFFSKSFVLAENGERHEMLTFGPLGVLPEYQGQGIGGALIKKAQATARELGYRGIIIYGYPEYYQQFGFRPGKEFGISDPEGNYPYAHLALEVYPEALKGISGKAFESQVFQVDEAAVAAFDQQFPEKERKVTTSQQKFAETVTKFL